MRQAQSRRIESHRSRRDTVFMRAFTALAIVVVAGMSCRGIRGTPRFISKDVADALWAVAIYLGLRFCFPRQSIRMIASAAALLAFGIEFLKLYHAPWFEAIRNTRLGEILFGKYFHWADLLRCAVGIALAMWADRIVISGRL